MAHARYAFPTRDCITPSVVAETIDGRGDGAGAGADANGSAPSAGRRRRRRREETEQREAVFAGRLRGHFVVTSYVGAVLCHPLLPYANVGTRPSQTMPVPRPLIQSGDEGRSEVRKPMRKFVVGLLCSCRARFS